MIYLLWLKAFHIIFVVCWFAGLFYLPRLMVYHASTQDQLSCDRFKLMEKRLYYGIMWPGGLLTTLLGCGLISINFHYYMTMPWMHAKIGLVLCVWIYHLYLGQCLKKFKHDANQHSEKFYRILNEVPTFLLISIVILVVVQP